MAAKLDGDYLWAMAQPDRKFPTESTETVQARVERLAEEDRLTEDAELEAEREGTIPAEEVFAWLRSLDADNPLPELHSRKDDVWREMDEAQHG